MYRGSGSQPYDPMTLLKMALYQYLKGNQSPAVWYEEAKLNKAMQWLGRGYVPSRRTWYDFRDRVGKFIDQLHEQIIAKALDEGHLDPTVGVQDGTAVAACASRHRMVNRSTLENRTTQLDAILQGDGQESVGELVAEIFLHGKRKGTNDVNGIDAVRVDSCFPQPFFVEGNGLQPFQHCLESLYLEGLEIRSRAGLNLFFPV